ncbi:MAG TPA: hypothetical protein VGC87_07835 [Pyrinomonadaceae bacterium]|jgi:hypothetical protein
MSNASSLQQESGPQLISQLVEISKLDTLYRDLYLQRARGLMSAVLSHASYSYLKDSIASLGMAEGQLRTAVQRGDWKRAGELTERVRTIRASAATGGQSLALAESVYDGISDVPIDPFSPGFHAFFGDSTDTLRQWRARAVGILSQLERTNPLKRDFYSRRRADFQALQIGAQTEQKKVLAVSPVDLRQEALSALESGDFSQLDRVVQKLAKKSEVKEAEPESAAVELTAAAELGDDLLFPFSEETLAAAGRLGLAPVRTHSRRHFAYLIPYGWQPSFLKSESKKWARDQLTRLPHPSESGDKARDAIELYLLNPLINSGGARYHVCLVEEDLLVEDFAEPEPKAAVPGTGLLSALGLESRWGLTRIDIENALLEHGPRILEEELKLDPEAFRLVAVPPDIYTNLGPERGWGQQEMWTHFDGYWVREGGKLQALAGGDKRFGGTHDVVSFPLTYTNEKILARFAVVQRRRMMTWHQK